MHSPRFPQGALSIALAAALSAGSAAAGSQRFQGWTPLSDYVTAGLAEGGSFRLTVPTRRGNVEVALQPVRVHAPGYHAEEVLRHGRRGRGRPEVHSFAGSPLPEGGAAARAARGGDFARLALEPGGRVSGLMRVDGVFYDLAADAAVGDLVLHVREVTPEELGEVLAACGAAIDEALAGQAATADASGEGGDAAPSSAAAGGLREIELGTEADAPFVSQAGGLDAANARILSMVNSINGIYEFDLGLTNRVVVQRGWNGSDPYTSSNSDTLLNEFRNEFLANVNTTTDDAQLFSGRDFESNTVGRAFVSSTCGSYRFGVNQFYQQSDSLTRLIVAHEMGHNHGASHSTTGIMAPSINPSVTWFSSQSQSQIGSYLGAVSCLETVSVGGPPLLAPIGPQSVAEGATLGVQLSASDPDGDAVHWSATPLPSGASLSASGWFAWQPGFDTVGCGGFDDVAIEFSARDPHGNRASEVVVISVLDSPTGAPPVFADPADRSVTAGQALSIPLSASDADGDSVSFDAATLPAGASLSPAGMFGWTPSDAQVGTYSLSFSATDCTGENSAQDLSIEVASTAPRLGSLSSATGWRGDVLMLSGSNLAGKKVRVYFGPRKAKARDVTATSLSVKVPRKSKRVVGNDVSVTVLRDGVVSDNSLGFTYVRPLTP